MRNDELLTTKEIAEWLKVPEGTIRNWVHFKKIPYIKVNKLLRFKREEIEKCFTIIPAKKEYYCMIEISNN